MSQTDKSSVKTIDIIIPVYNNIHLTLACIQSLYKNLANHINKIIIHDDCSDTETMNILAELHKNILEYHNLVVIRSEPNIGFAAGVNKACSLSESPYLFILNSDTEVQADIITPMLSILENVHDMAAINPSGPVFRAKKVRRCLLSFINPNQSNNKSFQIPYIKTAQISGYALLIKADIFKQLGGFNTIYGRGYYEDTELSRELVNHNYKLAIYPTDQIAHVGQSSFKQITPNNKKTNNFAKELIAKNKELYLSRYPAAKQKLIVKKIFANYNKFSTELQQQISTIIKNGGEVVIQSLFTPKNLPLYGVKFKRLSLFPRRPTA